MKRVRLSMRAKLAISAALGGTFTGVRDPRLPPDWAAGWIGVGIVGPPTAVLVLDWIVNGRARANGSTATLKVLMTLAGALAGRRHIHLRDAWAADQYDPETGELLPVSRRLRLAAGDVAAALRCRLDDASELAWRPADALLSSRHGSNLATFLPVTVAVGLVASREGFYGLVMNAENLGVIAAAPYAAIKVLRRYRQISTPRRPEKKASSAGGPER